MVWFDSAGIWLTWHAPAHTEHGQVTNPSLASGGGTTGEPPSPASAIAVGKSFPKPMAAVGRDEYHESYAGLFRKPSRERVPSSKLCVGGWVVQAGKT